VTTAAVAASAHEMLASDDEQERTARLPLLDEGGGFGDPSTAASLAV
jgi:hypothetical protein